MTRWALWVRGRIRTTVVLGDGTGEHLADLRMQGWPRTRRRLTAVDTQDRTWTVVVAPGLVTVDRDGERRATVRGDEVDLGGRRLTWAALEDGADRGPVTDPDDGRALLTVTPAGRGKDVPTAVIDLDDALPERFALALAACAVHLRAHGSRGTFDGFDPSVVVDVMGA